MDASGITGSFACFHVESVRERGRERVCGTEGGKVGVWERNREKMCGRGLGDHGVVRLVLTVYVSCSVTI
jgi:hypothetical protein